jgi:rRNA maturation endonuclease Nob1
MRLSWGLRVGRGGIRPYMNVHLGSWTPGKHTASRKTVMIYHCSRCGHINAQNSKFCSGCGASFTA